LMDEPLGALDRQLRQAMQVEIRRLQRLLGVTVIYVTHDQEEALTMSDRIALVCNGRVEQVGSARTLYEHPASRFVASFIGESNFFAGRVGQRQGEHLVFHLEGGTAVRAPAEGPHRDEQAFVLAVRPEDIVFSPDADGYNTIAGVVEECIYLG